MFTLMWQQPGALLKDVPTYTYKCTACDEVIEKRQSFSDPPLTTCEQCGGALRKIIHPVGIVFKGSGWYINDSRSSSSTSKAASTSGEDGKPATPTPSSGDKTSKDSSAASTSTATEKSSN